MCVVRGSDNLIWDGGGGLFIPPSSSSSLWRSGSFCSPSGRQLRHQLPPPPQQRPPRPEGGGSCRSTPARVRPALPPPPPGRSWGVSLLQGKKHRRKEISNTQTTACRFIDPCNIRPSVLYPSIQTNAIVSFIHSSTHFGCVKLLQSVDLAFH